MTKEDRDRKRIRDLFALMGSPNPAESEAAKRKLEAFLRKLGKTWNDLPELLQATASPQQPPPDDPRDAGPLGASPFDTYDPMTTARGIIGKYVALAPHEADAVALWTLHTHIFDQFMVTPRLLLTRPY